MSAPATPVGACEGAWSPKGTVRAPHGLFTPVGDVSLRKEF